MNNASKFQGKKNGQSNWMGLINQLEKEKSYIDISAYVSFQILSAMRLLGLKQKDLAEMMEVSPQQVSKILSGQENLTIETIGKLKAILEIDIDISNEGIRKFLNPPVVYVESVENRDHYFLIKTKHYNKKAVGDHIDQLSIKSTNLLSALEYFSDDYVGAEGIAGVIIEETANCH